jgi:hypothetical protein
MPEPALFSRHATWGIYHAIRQSYANAVFADWKVQTITG